MCSKGLLEVPCITEKELNVLKARYLSLDKETIMGSSHRGSVVMNLTSIHEDVGSIPGLTQCIKDPVLP